MDPWLARADELCYEGEEITESARLGDGGVAVTTHRVLAFSPGGDGPNFRQADRPNVEGISRDDGGDAAWLERGLKLLLVGAVLGIAGTFLDLDGLIGGVDLSGGSQVGGLGGVLGLVRGLLAALALLDDLMLVLGGVALLGAAGALGAYLWTRESTLRVAVAGGENLTVPAEPWPGDEVVGRLERAIDPPPAEADSDDPLA